MRKEEYIRQAKKRIARAEAEANATILRAIDRVLHVLYREATEMRIRMDRDKRCVRR